MNLSPTERRAVEAALAAERSATSARVVALSRALEAIVEASAMAVADDEHDPEGATIGFERAQLASLLDEARTRLERLDRAQERLATGEYGSCESCGRPIAVERLVARPIAETCVECAEGAGLLAHRPRHVGLGPSTRWSFSNQAVAAQPSTAQLGYSHSSAVCWAALGRRRRWAPPPPPGPRSPPPPRGSRRRRR